MYLLFFLLSKFINYLPPKVVQLQNCSASKVIQMGPIITHFQPYFLLAYDPIITRFQPYFLLAYDPIITRFQPYFLLACLVRLCSTLKKKYWGRTVMALCVFTISMFFS